MASAWVVPSMAAAKKKKKPAAVPSSGGGDATKDVKLSKGDGGRPTLTNRSSSQRIIVAIRLTPAGSKNTTIDAYSLEPGQEVPVFTGGAVASIASAVYD
jgi:hypothetical protein